MCQNGDTVATATGYTYTLIANQSKNDLSYTKK